MRKARFFYKWAITAGPTKKGGMAKRLGWACYIFSVILAALVLLFPAQRIARHVEALVAESLPGFRLQAIDPALVFPPALAFEQARLTIGGRLAAELEDVRLGPTLDFPPRIKLTGGGDDRVSAVIRENKAGDAVSVAFTLRDLPAFSLPLAENGVALELVPGVRVLARISGKWSASGQVDLQEPPAGRVEISGTGMEIEFSPELAGISRLGFTRIQAGGELGGQRVHLGKLAARGDPLSMAVSRERFFGAAPGSKPPGSCGGNPAESGLCPDAFGPAAPGAKPTDILYNNRHGPTPPAHDHLHGAVRRGHGGVLKNITSAADDASWFFNGPAGMHGG